MIRKTSLFCTAALLLLLGSLAPAGAGEKKIIEGVKPFPGPQPAMKIMARMVRMAVDPTFTDDEMFGLSGTAFLATVCANNCTCRDFREMSIHWKALFKDLGISYEDFDGKDEAIWTKIKASIDQGVPVLAWNLFGDHDDAILLGYDLDADEACGLGRAHDGAPAKTSLSKWKAGGMWGYIVHPGKKTLDRAAVWPKRLHDIVLLALRPPLEGG
jgi:hypothetical protein